MHVHELAIGPAHLVHNWQPLRARRPRPVVLLFWRLGSPASLNMLNQITGWRAQYEGLQWDLVLVHAPEVAFEAVPSGLDDVLSIPGVSFVHDHDGAIRRGHKQHWVPSAQLIDERGALVQSYAQSDLKSLAADLGRLTGKAHKVPVHFSTTAVPSEHVVDLGGVSMGRHARRAAAVGHVQHYRVQEIAGGRGVIDGAWRIHPDHVQAVDGTLSLFYEGEDVYLGIGAGDGQLEVEMDGKSLDRSLAGEAVDYANEAAVIAVAQPGLYHVLTHASKAAGEVVLRPSAGMRLYQAAIV